MSEAIEAEPIGIGGVGGTGRGSGRDQPFATVEVHHSVAPARAAWQALATDRPGSGYQSPDWIDAWIRHLAAAEGLEPAIVVAHDAVGRPTMLLPLGTGMVGPVRVARFLGGKHVNFNLGLWRVDAADVGQADLRGLLKQIARRMGGVGVFAFTNQPLVWQGRANPLARLPGQPSPSLAYKVQLDPDPDAFVARRFSKDALGKIARKERKLAEIGAIRCFLAATQEEAASLLGAFHAQKAERLRAQGIPDPFATDGTRAFLAEAATTGPGRAGAAIELYGLTAGDRVIAVYGAAVTAERFSGMFTSFDQRREIARFSPGDVLLMKILRDCCRRGIRTFDLGIGEASYKLHYCDEVEPLVDSFVAVSAPGRVLAGLLAAKNGLKRRVKQDARLLDLIERVRRRGPAEPTR